MRASARANARPRDSCTASSAALTLLKLWEFDATVGPPADRRAEKSSLRDSPTRDYLPIVKLSCHVVPAQARRARGIATRCDGVAALRSSPLARQRCARFGDGPRASRLRKLVNDSRRADA